MRGILFGILTSKLINLQNARYVHHSCKILILGGGTGGCTMAAKFSRKFNEKPNHVIVIEPSEVHYYQPIFTLIGGGDSKFENAVKKTRDVLPKNVEWLADSVACFNPENNLVSTNKGDTVQYEIMIVALGLQANWDSIPGLVEGLENPEAKVCSIYGSHTVSKVFSKIKETREGSAFFTFPNTPIKCPGAPQKIAYLADDFWRKEKQRDNIKIFYNTSLPVIFGVKKYADSLWKVCKQRDIQVNVKRNLIEINPEKRQAIFQNLDKPQETFIEEYSLLHVSPPMSTPKVLKEHSNLTNEAGFLTVSPETLRHEKYTNIYGLGDCTNTPNSKTMAAIASQSRVVYKNILDQLEGKKLVQVYDGYSSCPLITGYGKCILAEFNYKLEPKETFPVDQGREYYLFYLLKKFGFPFIYWNLMLKGYWDGPEKFRMMFHPLAKK